jgi:hypothetical protein
MGLKLRHLDFFGHSGPSIDGRLVTGSPTELIAEGAYVHIPTIAGDVLDE